MTYNVLMGTWSPTHSLAVWWWLRREHTVLVFCASGLWPAGSEGVRWRRRGRTVHAGHSCRWLPWLPRHCTVHHTGYNIQYNTSHVIRSRFTMLWPVTHHSTCGNSSRVADVPFRHRLPFSTACDLIDPAVQLTSVASCSFPVAGALIWNTLPLHVTSAKNTFIYLTVSAGPSDFLFLGADYK